MVDFRCYIECHGDLPQQTIHLDQSESSHLVKVRRARLGNRVSVFDGKGNEWDCRLEEANPKSARLRIHRHRQIPRPHHAVTLAQALLKSKAMEFMIEKATELGVSHIIPLATAHSEVHLRSDQIENKVNKWRALTIKACKQSTNPFLPAIAPVENLQTFCHSLTAPGLKLMAALTDQTMSLREALTHYASAHDGALPHKSIWLIGPEGDFTGEEYSLARACDFHPITLGPIVLRAETAALTALSILTYELREWTEKS